MEQWHSLESVISWWVVLLIVIKVAYAEMPWALLLGGVPMWWTSLSRPHIGTPHARASLGGWIFALLVHKHVCLESNNEPLREPPPLLSKWDIASNYKRKRGDCYVVCDEALNPVMLVKD